MQQTLEAWYSQNQLTSEQYYQLIDLINLRESYSLAELILLADLPITGDFPDPDPHELTKYQR